MDGNPSQSNHNQIFITLNGSNRFPPDDLFKIGLPARQLFSQTQSNKAY